MDSILKQIIEHQKLLLEEQKNDWLNNDFLSLRWWVLVAALILPWFLFFLLVDRRRFKEILLYGLITSQIAILLDELGSQLGLWTYPVEVIPFLPRLTTVNYTMVPVIFMLLYQYFPGWKSFITADIVLTLIFSFIAEPILVATKLYVLFSWRFIYSVPVYFLTLVFIKWLLERVKAVQNRKAAGN